MLSFSEDNIFHEIKKDVHLLIYLTTALTLLTTLILTILVPMLLLLLLYLRRMSRKQKESTIPSNCICSKKPRKFPERPVSRDLVEAIAQRAMQTGRWQKFQSGTDPTFLKPTPTIRLIPPASSGVQSDQQEEYDQSLKRASHIILPPEKYSVELGQSTSPAPEEKD